jgi:putative chitinase
MGTDHNPNLNPDLNPDLKRSVAPPGEVTSEPPPVDTFYDRKKFFDAVTAEPFNGNLTQGQVDGMNYLLNMWEKHFAPWNPNDGTMMLAYILATAYHETAATMEPIAEYGQGSGHSYGAPAGPYGECYYGRGYVQLTWWDNYVKGESILRDKYGHPSCEIEQFPDKMLEHEPSALILMDGSYFGWFTGASLQQYFSKANGIEDAYNARRVINGTDKADTIANYYWSFKKALT